MQMTPVQADSILRLARGGGNRAVYCRRYPDVGHGFEGNEPRIVAPIAALLDDVARFARLALVDGRPPVSARPACRREPPRSFVPGARLRNAALTTK
jgi:hypothetical protein